MQTAGEEWSKQGVEKRSAKALRQGVHRCEMRGRGWGHWIWGRVSEGWGEMRPEGLGG